MSLSWTPQRNGNIYCAPACGRGCTIEEYRKAQEAALKLAVRLSSVSTDVCGGRWLTNVHENLGWHYSVGKGSVSVSGNHGYWMAFLNRAGPWGGNLVRSAKTPGKAVRAVMQEAKKQLRPMIELAERLEYTRP